jgi:hypothetical protein
MTEADPMEVEPYRQLCTTSRGDYSLACDEDETALLIVNISRKYPEVMTFSDDCGWPGQLVVRAAQPREASVQPGGGCPGARGGSTTGL